MIPEQQANYMLVALENQRNAAQNECVQLAAKVMELQKTVSERDETIADKDTEIAALKALAELEAEAQTNREPDPEIHVN